MSTLIPGVDNSQIQKQFTIIEKKTGRNPKLVVGILVASIILSAIGNFGRYVTCVVGITLPAYWSIKAIESPEVDDDKQWLTYWAVYAVFTFIDLFAGFIMKFLPFYFFGKLIFLIWLFMPNTQGAVVVYNLVISKLFNKFEKKIDAHFEKLAKKGKEAMQKGKEFVNENKKEIINAGLDAYQKVNEVIDDKKEN